MSRLANGTVCLAALAVVLWGSQVGAADDLQRLVRDYEYALDQLRTGRSDRPEFRELAVTRLTRIADLDTKSSLAYLCRQLEARPVEIAVAAVPLILRSSQDRAVPALFQSFHERHALVREAIIEELARSSVDVARYERPLISLALAAEQPMLIQVWPSLLGRLDTLKSARALLRLVPERRAEGAINMGLYGCYRKVARALAATEQRSVSEWLSAKAFRAAAGSPYRLAAVARAAGALRLEKTRPRLERLLGGESTEVRVAAARAITSLGAEPSLPMLRAAFADRHGRGFYEAIALLDAIVAADAAAAANDVRALMSCDDAGQRTIVLQCFAGARGAPVVEVILSALADDAVEVRAAALALLAEHRSKAVIAALTEHLERERDEGLRLDTLVLLVSLTALDLGPEAADWKKWWNANADTFVFSDEEDDSPTGLRRVTREEAIGRYFGEEVRLAEGDRRGIIFIADVSGSMGSGKGSACRRELGRFIRNAPDDALINIITFDDDAVRWRERLQPLAGNGRAEALDFVENMPGGGATDVFGAVELALEDPGVGQIYLFTDGAHNCGQGGSTLDFLRRVELRNRVAGARIHCVIWGRVPYLRVLAEESGGRYSEVGTR